MPGGGSTAGILTKEVLHQTNSFLLHIPRCIVCLVNCLQKPLLVMNRAELLDNSVDSKFQREEMSEASLGLCSHTTNLRITAHSLAIISAKYYPESCSHTPSLAITAALLRTHLSHTHIHPVWLSSIIRIHLNRILRKT